MIQITNAEVFSAHRALEQLANVPLEPAAAARIARLLRQLDEHVREATRERNELVERHAERNADAHLVPASDERLRERGMIRIDPDRRGAFEEELWTLLAHTVEVCGQPLRLTDLRRTTGESVDVPASVLIDLGPLFADEGHP